MIQKITAVAFLYQNNKLFLAKRSSSKKFRPGAWEMPGGHIEFGETMEDGLKREIKEELHIDIIIENPFHAFTYTTDNTKHTIEVVYFARMSNSNQEIQLNPLDHSEYKWISKKEAETFFLEQNKDEGTAAIKGFSLLKQKN